MNLWQSCLMDLCPGSLTTRAKIESSMRKNKKSPRCTLLSQDLSVSVTTIGEGNWPKIHLLSPKSRKVDKSSVISMLSIRREAISSTWRLRRLSATHWPESTYIKWFSPSTRINTVLFSHNRTLSTTRIFTDQFLTSEKSRCTAWTRNQSSTSRLSIRLPTMDLSRIRMSNIIGGGSRILRSGMKCLSKLKSIIMLMWKLCQLQKNLWKQRKVWA